MRDVGRHPRDGRAAAAITIRGRQTPVAVERLRRDADARWRLAALVLGQVDQTDHAADLLLVEPTGAQFFGIEVLLDVALEDRVQNVVRRQRLVVALLVAELGRWWALDH